MVKKKIDLEALRIAILAVTARERVIDVHRLKRVISGVLDAPLTDEDMELALSTLCKSEIMHRNGDIIVRY